MSELYEKILEIFEIPKINVDKANRRTLLRYATRVKFQKRREAFYSVCHEGTKSKVAICKTEDRPTWVHNLETLKTKALRVQLKGFLKEVGAFIDPSKHDLADMAEKKNWHQVIYMDDDSKEGGMHRGDGPGDDPTAGDGGRGSRRGRRIDASSGRNIGHVATPVRRARVRAFDQDKAIMSLQQDMQEILRLQHEGGNQRRGLRDDAQVLINDSRDSNRIRGRVIDVVRDYREGVADMRDGLQNRMDRMGDQLDVRLQEEQKTDARLGTKADNKLDDIKLLIQQGKMAGPLVPYADKKDDPLDGWGGPGLLAGLDALGGGDGTRVLQTKGGNCYFLDDEEKCVCKPQNWKRGEFSKTARNKLRKLAEKKAITCAKIDLLRCLTVEFRAQMKMWRRFNQNCQGDYLASITADEVKELTCKNKPVFSGPDLHTMKAVANCYAQSQNLCKGHADVMARWQDEKVTGEKGYTMGHLCYSDLVANARKFNDPWTRAALRHRKPDPVEEKTLICETADGGTHIQYIPERPEERREPIQLLPSVGGIPSSGSMTTNVMPSQTQDTMHSSGGYPGTSPHIHHIDTMKIPPPGAPKQLPPSMHTGTQTMMPTMPMDTQTDPIGVSVGTDPMPLMPPRRPVLRRSMPQHHHISVSKSKCADLIDTLDAYYQGRHVTDGEQIAFSELVYEIVMSLMAFDMNVSNFVSNFAKRTVLMSKDGMSRTKFDHLSRTLLNQCTGEPYVGYTQEYTEPDPDPCERLQNMLQYAQDKCLTNREFGIVWGIWHTFWALVPVNVQQQFESFVNGLDTNFRLSTDQFQWVISVIVHYCGQMEEEAKKPENQPPKDKKQAQDICELLDSILMEHKTTAMGDWKLFWDKFTYMLYIQNEEPQNVTDVFMFLIEQFRQHPSNVTDEMFDFIRTFVQIVCLGMRPDDKKKKKKKKLKEWADEWAEWEMDDAPAGVAVTGQTVHDMCHTMFEMLTRVENGHILDEAELSQFMEMAQQITSGDWFQYKEHMINLANSLRAGAVIGSTGLQTTTYMHDKRLLKRICDDPDKSSWNYCDRVIAFLEEHPVGLRTNDTDRDRITEALKNIFLNRPHWITQYVPMADRFLQGHKPAGSSRAEVNSEKYLLLDKVYEACGTPMAEVGGGATLEPHDVPLHTEPAPMPSLEDTGPDVGNLMNCDELLAFIRAVPIRTISSDSGVPPADAKRFWHSLRKMVRAVEPSKYIEIKAMSTQMFTGLFRIQERQILLDSVKRACSAYVRDVVQPADPCSKISEFFVEFDAGRATTQDFQALFPILKAVVEQRNSGSMPEVRANMQKLTTRQMHSSEIQALKNQLELMCEGKYPPGMKFSKFIPSPNNICKYLTDTVTSHMQGRTGMGLAEFETFQAFVQQIAAQLSTTERIKLLGVLERFGRRDPNVDLEQFKTQLNVVCEAVYKQRFTHTPTQDVSGLGERTWKVGDPDWETLDCTYLMERVQAAVNGDKFSQDEWSNYMDIWQNWARFMGISQREIAPVRLMFRALATGGGVRRSGKPTRVVDRGLLALEKYCKTIRHEPQAPAQWAVDWGNDSWEDLQKSCQLLYNIIQTVLRNEPIPQIAITKSFQEAWNLLKSNPDVAANLTTANLQAVDAMYQLLLTQDVIFNNTIRPDVVAGNEVITFVCAAVTDQIKQAGGDPSAPFSGTGEDLPLLGAPPGLEAPPVGGVGGVGGVGVGGVGSLGSPPGGSPVQWGGRPDPNDSSTWPHDMPGSTNPRPRPVTPPPDPVVWGGRPDPNDPSTWPESMRQPAQPAPAQPAAPPAQPEAELNPARICQSMVTLVEMAARNQLQGEAAKHLGYLPRLTSHYVDAAFQQVVNSTLLELQSNVRPLSQNSQSNVNQILTKLNVICRMAEAQEQADARQASAGGVGAVSGQPPSVGVSAEPPTVAVSAEPPITAVAADPAQRQVSANPPGFGPIGAATLTRRQCEMILTLLESSRGQQPDAQGQAFLQYTLLPMLTARNIGANSVEPAGQVIQAVVQAQRPLDVTTQRNLTWLVGVVKQLCTTMLSTATLHAVLPTPPTGPGGPTGPPQGPPQGPGPRPSAEPFNPEATLGMGGLGQPGDSPAQPPGQSTGPTETIHGADQPQVAQPQTAQPAPNPLAGLLPTRFEPIGGAAKTRSRVLPGFSAEPPARHRPQGYGYRAPLSRASSPAPQLPPQASAQPMLQVGDPCSWIPSLLRRKMNEHLSFDDLQGIRVALGKLKDRFPNQAIQVGTWMTNLHEVARLATHKQGLARYIEQVCSPKEVQWTSAKWDEFRGARRQDIQTPGRIPLQEFLQHGGLYNLGTRGVIPWAASALAQHGVQKVGRAIEQSTGYTMSPSEMAKLQDQGWHRQKGTGGDVQDAKAQMQLAQNMIDSAKVTIRNSEGMARSQRRDTQKKGRAQISHAESLIRKQEARIDDLQKYVSDVQGGPKDVVAPSPVREAPSLGDKTLRAVPSFIAPPRRLEALEEKAPMLEALGGLAPPLETTLFEDPTELSMGYDDDDIKEKTHAEWERAFKKKSREASNLWDDLPQKESGATEYTYKDKHLKRLKRILTKAIDDKKLESKDVSYLGKFLKQVRKGTAFKELEEKLPKEAVTIKLGKGLRGDKHMIGMKAILDKIDGDELRLNMDEMMMLYEVAGGDRSVLEQYGLIRSHGQRGYRKKKREYDEANIEANLLRKAVERSKKIRRKKRGHTSLVQLSKATSKRKGKGKAEDRSGKRAKTEKKKPADTALPESPPKRTRSRRKKKPATPTPLPHIVERPYARESVKPEGKPRQAKEGVPPQTHASPMTHAVIKRAQTRELRSPQIQAQRWATGPAPKKIPPQYRILSKDELLASTLAYPQAKRQRKGKARGKASVASNPGPYKRKE